MCGKIKTSNWLFLVSLVAWVSTAGPASAQNQYTISTQASVASSTKLNGIASDYAGNLFVVENSYNLIQEFNPLANNLTLTTVAGGPTNNDACVKGTATSIELNSPTGVAVDNRGNYFIAQTSCSIFRVNAGQMYQVSYTSDDYTGVAADGSGNLYFAAYTRNVVRKTQAVVPPTSPVSDGTIFAGTGTQGCTGTTTPQPATSVNIGSPLSLAVDVSGNLFIADYSCDVIWKVTTSGLLTLYAGVPGVANFLDGAATQAEFHEPAGVAVDLYGNVYVADWGNNMIREIFNGPNGLEVARIAGTGIAGSPGEGDGGPAKSALINHPYGVTVGPEGAIFFTDQGTQSVRMLMPEGSRLTFPAPGSTLTNQTVTFEWNSTPGATGYSLTLTSSGQPGSGDIIYSNSNIPASATSVTVTGIPVDGRTIYADLQTDMNGPMVDPGWVVYNAASELSLILSPSTVSPGGSFTAEMTAWHDVEGTYTIALVRNVPPICHPFGIYTICTPGLTETLYTSPSFNIGPCVYSFPGPFICLPYWFTVNLAAPTTAGTYSYTAYLYPVGSTTPIDTASATLTVP